MNLIEQYKQNKARENLIDFVKDHACEYIISFSQAVQAEHDFNGTPVIFRVEDDINIYSLNLDVDHYGYFETEADRLRVITENEVIEELQHLCKSNEYQNKKIMEENDSLRTKVGDLESLDTPDEIKRLNDEIEEMRIFKENIEYYLGLMAMKKLFESRKSFFIPNSCGDIYSVAGKLNPYRFVDKNNRNSDALLESINNSIQKEEEYLFEQGIRVRLRDVFPLD